MLERLIQKDSDWVMERSRMELLSKLVALELEDLEKSLVIEDSIDLY